MQLMANNSSVSGVYSGIMGGGGYFGMGEFNVPLGYKMSKTWKISHINFHLIFFFFKFPPSVNPFPPPKFKS